MADYPTSVKSFASRSAGQSIGAAHVNDLQNEVAAIETELVTSGLTNLLKVNAGVQFPAVQVASTNVNTLDDYEEGSWTPVLGGAGGTSGQTYSTQVGRYIKVGKFVWCQGTIVLSAKGTITGALELQGLPFTSENTAGVSGVCNFPFWAVLATAVMALGGYVAPNTTAVTIQGLTVAAVTTVSFATADVNNTTQLIFDIRYRAAS